MRSIFLAALFLTPGLARGASLSLDTLAVGGVTDTVHAASDPTQTYALFVPSRYEASRRWPLLLLMDPRGRAMVPLKLFQPAAERYGYIVMSSYQTQSDGSIEPNDKAINAMLADAQAKFSIDARRFYFAGFSGTGRLAWYYGYSIPENAAGLIEVGAGLPEPDLLLRKRIADDSAHFAVFLSVGSTDFNYEEVHVLDAKLEVFGIRHHLETFDGVHSWPPESVCDDAITWMQLQAMRDGRLAIDRAWVDSLFSAAARHADEVSTLNRYAAFILYEQLESDFAGIHDIEGVKAAADRLVSSESVKRTQGRLGSLAAAAQIFHQHEDSFFADLAKTTPQLSTDKLREILDLDALRDRASQTKDTLDALAASRLLSSVFIRASFYEPRRYLALGDTLSSLRAYALAQSIHPDDAALCAERNRLYRAFAVSRSVPRELGCDANAKSSGSQP